MTSQLRSLDLGASWAPSFKPFDLAIEFSPVGAEGCPTNPIARINVQPAGPGLPLPTRDQMRRLIRQVRRLLSHGWWDEVHWRVWVDTKDEVYAFADGEEISF